MKLSCLANDVEMFYIIDTCIEIASSSWGELSRIELEDRVCSVIDFIGRQSCGSRYLLYAFEIPMISDIVHLVRTWVDVYFLSSRTLHFGHSFGFFDFGVHSYPHLGHFMANLTMIMRLYIMIMMIL